MWKYLIQFSLTILILMLFLMIIKDLIPYIRYKLFYSSQGLKYHYQPLLGTASSLLDLKGKDIYSKFKEVLARKYKDEKVVLFNKHDKLKLLVMINDVELLKEFFLKENENVRRIPFLKMPISLGFFNKNGHQALTQRAIFNEFFLPKNLCLITPKIQKIIEKKFTDLKIKLWGNKINKFDLKEIEMKEFTPKLFSEIVNEILFGSDDYPIFPNGKTLPEETEGLMHELVKIYKSPLHIFTLGMLHNIFSFHPKSKEVNSRGKRVNEEILKIIKKRQKKNDEDLGVNLIDLMVKYNRNCQKEDIIEEDMMISNVILFQIAGIDTTKSSTETFIKLISSRKDVINKLGKEEIPNMFKKKKDFGEYETYSKSKYLNMIIDEVMRLYGPAATTFTREIVKDFKIGDYVLKKGDLVNVPILAIHANENNYENPLLFDVERFKDEKKMNLKRNSYIPFYSGKRACIGRYVAELVLRMVLSHFFLYFELESNGKEPEFTVEFSYVVKESKVKVRPREDHNWNI